MSTHLGERVRYPRGMRPGDRIEWSEGDRVRPGVVIDRAANGIGDGMEQAGYWLWVQPDDGGDLVRVRTWASGKRQGTAQRDDGPMYVRSMTGRNRVVARGHWYDVGDFFRRRTHAPCQCCEAAHVG